MLQSKVMWAMVAAMAAALAVGGCTLGVPGSSSSDDRLESGGPAAGDAPEWSYRRVELENAAMHGQMGDIRGFEAPATDAFAERIAGETMIELHLERPAVDGWVMARLNLRGVPGEEPMVVGSSFELTRASGSPEATATDENVVRDGLGCSGPRRGDWNYDEHVSSVHLEVLESPNPGFVRLAFDSTFDDSYAEGEHYVTAELDYPL